jgi:hypothetical protein
MLTLRDKVHAPLNSFTNAVVRLNSRHSFRRDRSLWSRLR